MARGDDESRAEGFLGRWARRKQEAQQPGPREGEARPPPPACGGEGLGMGGGKAGLAPSASPAPSGTAPHPTLPTASGGRAEPEPARPEPEIEPPSLDLIDKDFDLAHWLKQNVPESWKLAALRRAWESDPAIAGYLDPARDYALDWNTPGGAPGYGPLSESDNVEEMLANIFGKPAQEEAGPAKAGEESVRNDVAAVRPSSNEADGEVSAAPQRPAVTELEPLRLSATEDAGKSGENVAKMPVSPEGDSAAVQKPRESPESSRLLRRRGGGATPL